MRTNDDHHVTTRSVDLDIDGLLTRCQGSTSALATLLDLCMSQAVKDIDALCTAIDHCDANGVMVSAHNLRAMASLIGAERLRELAASIEDSGEAGNLSAVGQWSDQLEQEVERCIDTLRHLACDLQRLGQPVEA
jgi:HPt (histidine-containing phosphotransfer) domain-containing protein